MKEVTEPSILAKERIKKRTEKDLKRLEQMKEDIKNGVYDEVIKSLENGK